MERRTEEIIAVCKGRHAFGEIKTFRGKIAAYMSDRCDYPAEDYTDEILDGIIFVAVCDYIDGADKPSAFLRQIHESTMLHGGNLFDAICGAFSVVSVKHANGTYRNGFTEESVYYVDKSENIKEGRWKGAGMGDYSCSLCGHIVSENTKRICPECKARMD